MDGWRIDPRFISRDFRGPLRITVQEAEKIKRTVIVKDYSPLEMAIDKQAQLAAPPFSPTGTLSRKNDDAGRSESNAK